MLDGKSFTSPLAFIEVSGRGDMGKSSLMSGTNFVLVCRVCIAVAVLAI
jgi:hypothetical protein